MEEKFQQELQKNEPLPAGAEISAANTKKRKIPSEIRIKNIVIPIKTAIIAALVILLVITVITVISIAGKSGSKDGGNFDLSATITGIEKISNYNVVEFIHNGITIWYDEDADPAVYIYYAASVKIGIDVSKIRISEDPINKTVTFIIPEPEINNVEIDARKFDFIYDSKSDKSKFGNVSDSSQLSELYKICKNDVQYEIKNNSRVFELAKENLINSVDAVLKPLFKYGNGYDYLIVTEGDEQ